MHYIKERRKGRQASSHACEDEMKWYHKLQWFLFNIVSVIAVIVTGSYWLFVFDSTRRAVNLSDLNAHILNTVFILIEHSLSCMPVRLLHVVYPILFESVYVIATVLHWAMIVDTPLYTVVNYTEEPGRILGLFALAIFIFQPLIQLCLYGIFRLKMFVANKHVQP